MGIRKFTMGISPCPNDTYIFYALINKKLVQQAYEFDVIFKDVEELNILAIEGKLDICKMSVSAYANVSKEYQLLPTGGAFGLNSGPMLISKRKIYPDEIESVKIAVPGLHTTAMMLLRQMFPLILDPKEYVFNEIEDVVLSGECDAGLIIHENRFTYQKKGLIKIVDLGELWYQKYQLPVPLGGIAIRRGIKDEIKMHIGSLIQESINYSKNNLSEALLFIRKYASELDDEIIRKHIDMYVNDYSLSLDAKAENAVDVLFENTIKEHSKELVKPYFVGL